MSPLRLLSRIVVALVCRTVFAFLVLVLWQLVPPGLRMLAERQALQPAAQYVSELVDGALIALSAEDAPSPVPAASSVVAPPPETAGDTRSRLQLVQSDCERLAGGAR